MATVESFRTRDFLEPVDIDGIQNMIALRRDEDIAILEDDKEARARLDLEGQVALLDRRIAKAEQEVREESPLDASQYYPEISRIEQGGWNSWVPTVYDLKHYGHGYDYQYIPEQVLIEIAALQGLKMFEHMRVMSYNEAQAHEALLVGRVGNRMFRIARWGERLRSKDRVLAHVKRAEWYEKMKKFCSNVFCFTGLFALLIFLFFLWLGSLAYYDSDNIRRSLQSSCDMYATNAHTEFDRFVWNIHSSFNPTFHLVRNGLSAVFVFWTVFFVYFIRFNMTRYLDRLRR